MIDRWIRPVFFIFVLILGIVFDSVILPVVIIAFTFLSVMIFFKLLELNLKPMISGHYFEIKVPESKLAVKILELNHLDQYNQNWRDPRIAQSILREVLSGEVIATSAFSFYLTWDSIGIMVGVQKQGNPILYKVPKKWLSRKV